MKKFSQDIEQVLLPLKEFLDFDLIKTESELKLTYGIIYYDFHINHFDSPINISRELDNFKRDRKTMIQWLELFKLREDVYKEADYDALITELDNLEYIGHETLDRILSKKKYYWRLLYKELNTGEKRRNSITLALSNWVEYINTKGIFDALHWQKSIDKKFHYDALNVYSRAEFRLEQK